MARWRRRARRAPDSTRTPSSCRPTSSSADPEPPACAGGEARRFSTIAVPTVPGGGTVSATSAATCTPTSTTPTQREEGGTPAIVESIRAGLVFQLKECGGRRERSEALEDRAHPACHRPPGRGNPNLQHPRQPRGLAAVHRLLRGERMRPALSCTTTSSLLCSTICFGIQARGGCSCAGPYGHRLLGIDLTRSHEVRATRSTPRVRGREARAGCASTSTTSSATTCATSSLPPSSSSRGRGGASCPTTTSSPRPGSGGTGTSPGAPACACTTSATAPARCSTGRAT